MKIFPNLFICLNLNGRWY